MRKFAISLVALFGLLGCKQVDVSLPVPVRISGTVEVDDSTTSFSDTAFILSEILGEEIRERIEEAGVVTIDLESVVLVVSSSGCADTTSVEGEVMVGLASQLFDTDTLASMENMYPNEVLGDTLKVQLYSPGVEILNNFAQAALEGNPEALGLIVQGATNYPPVDFDMEIIVTFTVVVVREMMSIGL